ncbi:hypothetical protein [uncultured Amnibacterium sp.]|uniref:hypothetical protein n=1 Tax=uncultured Amnibacterium sp. TaxID=1631851 RepID=UPI0035CB1C85
MRTSRLVAVAAASLISLTALTACSDSDSQSCDRSSPRHLGIVYGATSNSAAPKLSTEASNLLDDAAMSNGSVTIVTPSGTPQITGPIPLSSAANDVSICIDDHVKAVATVKQALAKSAATTKEVDYLGAIADAASTDSGSSMGVVVVGSGLQTAGMLDFAKDGLLYRAPKSVADTLAANHELPAELKGLTIYWSGLGDVAAPQAVLPESAKQNLEAIWSAVIAKAGGELKPLSEHLTDAPRSGLPTVTTVPIGKPDIWKAPFSLNDDQLHFKGGSDRLSDREAAEAVLRPVATSIVKYRVHVTVTGATSAQGEATQVDDLGLSKRRAQTVIALLEKLHVPSDLLAPPAGVGHEWCGFQKEVATDGRSADEIAAANRRVILTSDGVGLCG